MLKSMQTAQIASPNEPWPWIAFAVGDGVAAQARLCGELQAANLPRSAGDGVASNMLVAG
jgi:hypothetical protein